MKLKFKDQDFQTAAVEAVAGLFAGQERSEEHTSEHQSQR